VQIHDQRGQVTILQGKSDALPSLQLARFIFSSLQTVLVEGTLWSLLPLSIHHAIINPSQNFWDETKIVFIQKIEQRKT
jgi:hypothetical protein